MQRPDSRRASPQGSAGAGARPPQRHEPALRLIIGYKIARAAASLVASALLAVLTAVGDSAPLHAVAEQLRRHATSAWSVTLADALVSAVAPKHLWLVAGALALDGTLTLVEGLSLHRSWRWGPWLVVVATGALLPYEVLALVRHAAAGRALLLALNLGVAIYLARRARRTPDARRPIG